MARVNIALHPDTIAVLLRPIRGDGGFQSLMRRIQLGLRGGTLNVEDADLDALVRAVKGRSVGGFQRRARLILVDVMMDTLRRDGMRIRDDHAPLTARVLTFERRQPRLPFGGDQR